MKRTNKILRGVCLILILCITALAAVSCRGEGAQGECRVVIASSPETVYTVNLSEIEITEGVYSVLKYLKESEGLEYAATESIATGAYLTDVEGLLLGNGRYPYVWTSVERDFDESGFFADVEFDGVVLKPSAVGISQMSLEDGAIIYIGYIEY